MLEDVVCQIDDISDIDPVVAIGIACQKWDGGWTAAENVIDNVDDVGYVY